MTLQCGFKLVFGESHNRLWFRLGQSGIEFCIPMFDSSNCSARQWRVAILKFFFAGIWYQNDIV